MEKILTVYAYKESGLLKFVWCKKGLKAFSWQESAFIEMVVNDGLTALKERKERLK